MAEFLEKIFSILMVLFCGWAMGNAIGDQEYSNAAILGLLGIYFAVLAALKDSKR